MSIMIASDNTRRPELNNHQLMERAPAIFATAPTHDASARYTFIPTIDVVDGLRAEGWLPVAAKQTAAQTKDRRDTALHMVRFRHPDLEPINIGNGNLIYPEAIMTNSHNLSNAFKFMMGAYQMLCSNGLVTGESFGSISVRHNTKAIDQAIAACFDLLDNAKPMMAQIDNFRQIELNPVQREAFAKSALRMKHGVHAQQNDGKQVEVVFGNPRDFNQARRVAGEDSVVEYIPITPEAILSPRRREDEAPTLWNTFNVIQENLMKGGQRSRSAKWRRNTTRGVSAIDKDVSLNRNLWGMAEYLAERVTA